MSVYIDPLLSCLPNRQWRWDKSCHLVSGDVEELHAFARGIGLKRSWFQNHTRLPHYDLNENRRRMAIKAGAIELSRREFYERFIRPVRENLPPIQG